MGVGEGVPGKPPRYRFPRAHFFRPFLCAEQRKGPAGGDGTAERFANTSGESAEGEAFAACGREGSRTRTFRAAARPHFSPRRNGGKTRRGTSSERTSLAPFPQNRNTAKTPYRSVAPPLQIETQGFDLRRTFRRNLQAATKGSCAVFRRIRTRNPSPTTKGAPPPLDSLLLDGGREFYGGRGTKGFYECLCPR